MQVTGGNLCPAIFCLYHCGITSTLLGWVSHTEGQLMKRMSLLHSAASFWARGMSNISVSQSKHNRHWSGKRNFTYTELNMVLCQLQMQIVMHHVHWKEYTCVINLSNSWRNHRSFSVIIGLYIGNIARYLEVLCSWLFSMTFQEHLTSQPFKDEAYLFYIRTQCVPRCKHSPLRL
jgi:hypothetical protein